MIGLLNSKTFVQRDHILLVSAIAMAVGCVPNVNPTALPIDFWERTTPSKFLEVSDLKLTVLMHTNCRKNDGLMQIVSATGDGRYCPI